VTSETELREQNAGLKRQLAVLQQRYDDLAARLEARCGATPLTPIEASEPDAAFDTAGMRVIENGDDDDERHDRVEATYVLAGPRAHVAILEFLLRDIATNCELGGGAEYRIIVNAEATGATTLERDGAPVCCTAQELATLARPSRDWPDGYPIDIHPIPGGLELEVV
jgi:hypothetical protein